MKLLSLSLHGRTAGVLADTINDVSSTRKVYLLAGGLALLGVALILITVWFWRTTRHDPEVLGPLEAIGTRKFRNLDDGGKQQLLEKNRPASAEPMKWAVVKGTAMEQPEVDLAAIGRAAPTDYDDLREPAESESESGAEEPVAEIADEPDLAALAAAGVVSEGVSEDEREITSTPSDEASDTASDDAVGDDAVGDASEATDDASEPVEAAIDEGEPESEPDMVADGGELASTNGQPPEDAAEPLVIAPLDVDLPEVQRQPVTVDSVSVTPDRDDTVVQSRVAIDPLLRRLESRD